MAIMNVSLPDPMKSWIEKQVHTGQYSNAGDYVRDLIRQDQKYQDKREILIKALIAGENSGFSNARPGTSGKMSKHGAGLMYRLSNAAAFPTKARQLHCRM